VIRHIARRRQARHVLGVAVLALIAWASPASADTVFVGGTYESKAGDGAGTTDLQSTPINALPAVGALGASTGGSVSDGAFVFTDTLFTTGLDHVRVGSAGAFAQTIASLSFTVTTDVFYSIDGFYDVTHAGTADLVGFSTQLFDANVGTNLLVSSQVSNATAAESFVVGGTGGDFANTLAGSVTGLLEAGKTYTWSFNAFVQGQGAADDGAVASGFLSLSLSTDPPVVDPPVVPLPPAAYGGGAMMAVMAAVHWRRRRAGLMAL
jgi:hypothetical protein